MSFHDFPCVVPGKCVLRDNGLIYTFCYVFIPASLCRVGQAMARTVKLLRAFRELYAPMTLVSVAPKKRRHVYCTRVAYEVRHTYGDNAMTNERGAKRSEKVGFVRA